MEPAVAPIVRWTPAEGWLMVELAKQLVVRIVDGADEPVRSVVAGNDGDLALELELFAETVTLALRLDHPSGHRWRGHWLLELTRGDEHWTLSAESSQIVIPAARGRIVVRPRLRQRALARELAGENVSIPINDVACHRYTRQSTARIVEGELVPWMMPSQPETAPWWEIDFAKSLYVAWVRIDLEPPPPGTRVVIRAYAFLSPKLEPPPDSIVFEALAEELATHAGRAAIALGDPVVARYLRVELHADQPVELAITATEVLACELLDQTLATTLRRSFALFRDRPLFLARAGDDYEPAASYGEIWQRAMAFARGLAHRHEPIADDPSVPERLRGRGVLAIITRSRPEWLIADLAGLIRGYVTVPLSPDEPDDRLTHVLSRAPATCIVCEATDRDRLRALAPRALVIACDDAEGFDRVCADGETVPLIPPAPRRPDDLHSVLFTSGSTGTPKGAMRTFASFFNMVAAHQVGHSPRHLSFQPLSHLSERMYMPSLLIHGGCLAFSQGGAHLFDELRRLGPTTLGSVPRLFEVLHAQYRRRLKALIAAEPETSRGELEKRALAESREAFGPRLSAISIGSAPVTREVFGFLKRCFADLWVSEGYGSTEVGTIATDGKINDKSQVKLVPLSDDPDRTDRGEIWVKSPVAIAGYLGDDEATAKAFDKDGYFATGDLGERDAAGLIRVVGRLRNTVKLAQGEFVSAERIETALANCPVVDRIFVHAASGAVGVSALISPHHDALAAMLSADGDLATLVARPEAAGAVLASIRAFGKRVGLAAYELPRGVLLEATPFTASSGLVTPNGKLARGTIAARYGAQLAALVETPATDDAPGAAPEDDDAADLRTRVVRVASRAIGRAIAIDEPLAAAGVDSLASAEILAALSDELGRDVPLAWWFEARTLDDLAVRLAHFADVGGPAALREQAAADLALPVIAQTARARPGKAHVLLTGATGFLGAHLVDALRDRGHQVSCLVRGGRDRLAHALRAREIATSIDQVRVITGDLGVPHLGIEDPTVLDGIDTVVHAGATVSWLASYDALRAPNVLGTRVLLELAASRGWTFHYVSTISTAPHAGDETSLLTFDGALAGTPYGLSKWIAEQHAQRAGVATIHRPAMIAPHTRTGIANPDDFNTRYLQGCLDLGLYIDRDDAIVDMTPVDFVAGAIATLLDAPPATTVYHLANADQSMSFAAIGRAMAAAGHAVKPAPYAEFRDALMRTKTSRLHALGAFFPETFNLGMGPFPCARSVADLEKLGVSRPKIDDAMIARMVARLAT